MANEQNLIKNAERTPTERKELARKAGIASGKARLKNKHGKELVRAILAMKEADPQILDEFRDLGLDPAEVTNEVTMHIRQIQKAKKKSDTKAYNAVNKAAGYEEQTVNIAGDVDFSFKFGE